MQTSAGATVRATGRRPGFGPGGVSRAPRAANAAALRAEVEDLKLLILAMWREVGGIERERPAAAQPSSPAAALDFRREVRRFESDLIRCALIRTGGRQRRAARLLGIKAATLNAKIKRYRIDADAILNQSAALRLRNR
jgi:DNA-binding NtrC family response regulator